MNKLNSVGFLQHVAPLEYIISTLSHPVFAQVFCFIYCVLSREVANTIFLVCDLTQSGLASTIYISHFKQHVNHYKEVIENEQKTNIYNKRYTGYK